MESILSTPVHALAAATIVFVLGYEWLIYRSHYRKGLPVEMLQRIEQLCGSLRLPEPAPPEADTAN